MNLDTEKIIPHFEALLLWTKEGLGQANLPYTYYQYMKLKEALESVIDSLTCFTSTEEDLPQSSEHQGTALKIVVDNAPLDKLRHHQDMIRVPLPML
jgi:hypothetical protein